MTDRVARIVTVDRVEPHPDADRLDIAHVSAYPCIVKRGEFKAGDAALYIPIDMTVPVDRPEFAFLAAEAKADGRFRVRARRLRGVFSMGLLLPARSATEVEALDIRPYEAPWEMDTQGLDAPAPRPEPPAYDVESLRRFPDILQIGELVEITEKLHGSNMRVYRDSAGALHVGSHTRWKDPAGASEWAYAARQYDWSALRPGICLYGECIGRVGGFGYGVTRGQVDVRIFDGFDVEHWRWLSTDGVLRRCRMPFNVIDPDGIDCGLGNVPLLYAGPWQGFDHAASLAEGPSTLAGHVREGIVVRPAEPRFDARCGRVLFKLHGRGFLLKREG